MAYMGIKEILLDAMSTIPEYKDYFVAMYLERPKGVIVNFDPIVNVFVKEFMDNEADYFNVVNEFVKVEMWKYYKMGVFTPEMYHRLICLAVIMPNMVKFLQTRSAEIAIFKTYQHFLQFTVSKRVPSDYYVHLALLMCTDELAYRLKHEMTKEGKKRIERELDTAKIVSVRSFMVLSKYAKISRERLGLLEKPKPTDIILYNGRPYGIRLFEGSNATVNIILADRGCGKTIGLLRVIQAVEKMGYVVIIFGNDLRKELRFASFPMSQKVNPTMYDTIFRQGEKPTGLPMTIYCDNPEYPIEKDIKGFGSRPRDWESLNGVVLFESEEVLEKVVEVERDEFLEGGRVRTKIYREHRLSNIIDSFVKWRSKNRKKKIVLCLNEAQRFIGSVVDKDSWGLFHSGEKLFTEIRGLGVPVVMNTQYLSRIKKSGQQFDVLYASLITSPEERYKVAEIYNIKSLKTLLAMPTLKTEHAFFKVENGKTFKVRFLAPGCLPENNQYSLNDLFSRKKPPAT